MPRAAFIPFLACAFASLPALRADQAMNYPPTKQVQQTDDFHGTKVADPYRWLEDDVRKSKDVADWVDAQNKVTFGYLEGIPQRKPLQTRIKQLMNYERFSAP